MHASVDPTTPPTPPSGAMAPSLASASATDAVRALARRLHRAARSESLALSLPVLRRLIATGAWAGVSLPALCRQRAQVQRKHLLRMLAVEAGHGSWEAYSAALKTMTADQLPHFDMQREQAAHLNLWFSDRAQAQAHAAAHGGRVLDVGQQAVVLLQG